VKYWEIIIENLRNAGWNCGSMATTDGKGRPIWVVYQKNMRKTILLAGCALLLGTAVIASDFAADPLNFRNPQQDLFGNLSEMLREMKELQSCEKQQEEALQRFLEAGLSLNAAALMAHNQYPCD
jgi:hypothetical protein